MLPRSTSFNGTSSGRQFNGAAQFNGTSSTARCQRQQAPKTHTDNHAYAE